MNLVARIVLEFGHNHYDSNLAGYVKPLEQLQDYIKKNYPDILGDDNHWMSLVESFEYWLLMNNTTVFCAECDNLVNLWLDDACPCCGIICDNIRGGLKFLRRWEVKNTVFCLNCTKEVNIKGHIELCPHCNNSCDGLFIFTSKGEKV